MIQTCTCLYSSPYSPQWRQARIDQQNFNCKSISRRSMHPRSVILHDCQCENHTILKISKPSIALFILFFIEIQLNFLPFDAYIFLLHSR